MMLADYLNDIACAAAPENLFAQDAIDHAITTGLIQLSYNFKTDEQLIAQNYDLIVAHYHEHLARHADAHVADFAVAA